MHLHNLYFVDHDCDCNDVHLRAQDNDWQINSRDFCYWKEISSGISVDLQQMIFGLNARSTLFDDSLTVDYDHVKIFRINNEPNVLLESYNDQNFRDYIFEQETGQNLFEALDQQR